MGAFLSWRFTQEAWFKKEALLDTSVLIQCLRWYMRLWSIHPGYLDRQGLLALWREALLAQNVLAGKTKGYKNHPQLERFKKHPQPLCAISRYCWFIYQESRRRHYRFNKKKIFSCFSKKIKKIPIHCGQLVFEFRNLLKKTKKRSPAHHAKLLVVRRIQVHPLFMTREGERECWEKSYEP